MEACDTSVRAAGDYSRSPVDNLESCFWVSVWSAFFNEDNTGYQSGEEKCTREELTENRAKGDAMDTFSGLET